MVEGRDRDSRSMSHDYAEDSDNDIGDGREGSLNAPGKPGRKKNPNSAAARRDQNRIAQREFRLRKQQRIRDLEARVEILSGSKDQTFSELRNIVRDLMQENQTLRNLLRSLGNYIGDGLGGILPSIGFERPSEFIDFINRAETDTAFEGFQRRKKTQSSTTSASAGGSGVNIGLSRKRVLDDDDPAQKRARGLDDHDRLSLNGSSSGKDHVDNGAKRYPPMLVPISPAAAGAGNSFYSPVGKSSQEAGLFSQLLQGQSGPGTASEMYMTGPASDRSNFPASSSISGGGQFPSAFHPPISVPSSLGSQAFMTDPALPFNTNASASAPTPSSTASSHADAQDRDDGIDDPKLQEATKLIHYHLDNYKRNNAYCLPQSLRPTLVQRTVPHESVIDNIPHPELRDRMILLRGRFDLVDALHEYTRSLTLHGDDVLAHNNWEIGESWLRHYGFLIDPAVLAICNRWRRERGETELLLTDISHSSQPDIPASV
ncbi:hypothetical protein EW145_g2272 [Phellinidium pouzarii]|uniref:BZIP domain-containing protein n=1 Tax=Phellinidium pouzarii TaxID=167371 RepID=A0A4S4LBX6_9AGAM|nr:hypothetical protein EW145_g2272 [Phellinidium pouzarii]